MLPHDAHLLKSALDSLALLGLQLCNATLMRKYENASGTTTQWRHVNAKGVTFRIQAVAAKEGNKHRPLLGSCSSDLSVTKPTLRDSAFRDLNSLRKSRPGPLGVGSSGRTCYPDVHASESCPPLEQSARTSTEQLHSDNRNWRI